MELTIRELKKKGKAQGFSYIQSLSLYIYEEILCWVSQSELKESLWLKPEKETKNQIHYYMKTKDISYEVLEAFISEEIKKKSHSKLQIQESLQFLDNQIEILLQIQWEQVKLPFKMIIRPVWLSEQFPEEEQYPLRLHTRKEISCWCYPKELALAESFYEILDRLELIGDMQSYGRAYDILQRETISGRHIYRNLAVILENAPMDSREKRWDTILGYRNYTYMKKRWDKYKKEEDQEETSWEEVISLLDIFFTPVWTAILQDQIFFEDWMPHLGRFLG